MSKENKKFLLKASPAVLICILAIIGKQDPVITKSTFWASVFYLLWSLVEFAKSSLWWD